MSGEPMSDFGARLASDRLLGKHPPHERGWDVPVESRLEQLGVSLMEAAEGEGPRGTEGARFIDLDRNGARGLVIAALVMLRHPPGDLLAAASEALSASMDRKGFCLFPKQAEEHVKVVVEALIGVILAGDVSGALNDEVTP